MSKQDANEETDSTPDEEGESEVERDEPSESLEEIAQKPSADAEAVFAEIIEDDGEPESTEVNEEISVDEEFISEIEKRPPRELARLITTLDRERTELASELDSARERADDLESRLKRKQADFQNYKKRQKKRLEEEKERATEDLVGRLLDVRDNLARALDQDESADIRGGVESTLEQFDRELDRENVAVIEPEAGVDVDPQRHEVLIRIDSDQPADTVAQVHRPGYEMAGKVLRPAQVAVSDGSTADESE